MAHEPFEVVHFTIAFQALGFCYLSVGCYEFAFIERVMPFLFCHGA